MANVIGNTKPAAPVTIKPGMPGLTFGSQTSNVPTSRMPLPVPKVGPSDVRIGNNPGIIKTPQPTTPVKSQTTPDGVKTTYHAPVKEKTPTQTPAPTTPTPTPAQNTTPGAINEPTVYKPENLGTQGISQGGLIGNLVTQSQNASPEYLAAQAEANRIAEERRKLAQEFAQKDQNINRTAGFLTQAAGLEGQLQQQYNQGVAALSAQEQSAASRLAAANTQQQLQQSALGTAISANAPIQQSYGNMLINPATGQPYQQNTANLQSIVSSVADKVKTGQMTYNDAINALSGYGQGGVNALLQTLPQGFNIAQSNTLAGQQGSVNVNYKLADTALNNAESIMESLGLFSNIPILNKARTWASLQTGLGSENTRAYIGAIQSLRNSYASLLASAKGGTPTDYSNQAMAEIPEIPTKKDLEAIRHNFETLGKARVDILGNPGLSGNQTMSGRGGFAEAW